MIEATNSVLATMAISRKGVELSGAMPSSSVDYSKVEMGDKESKESVSAPYISPYLYVDPISNKAVLQIRDSETGDVQKQIPSETQLKAYRRAQGATPHREIRENKPEENEAISSGKVAESQDNNSTATATPSSQPAGVQGGAAAPLVSETA